MKLSRIAVHLGNLCTGVGNSEQSNKMTSYATIRKCLVVHVSLWRESTAESSCFTIYRAVKQEVWAINVRKGINVAHLFARKVVTGNPRRSVRRLAQQIRSQPALQEKPAVTPCRCLRTTCSGGGIAWRCAFAREYGALLEGSSGVVDVTWFSHGAHFQLDFYQHTETQKPPQQQESHNMIRCYSVECCQKKQTISAP
jgi:hypothetical protein